jgi:hypothetical protein
MFRRVWTRAVALSLTAAAASCVPGKGSEVEDVPPEVRFEKLRFEVYRGPAVEAAGTAAVARMRRDTGDLRADRIAVEFPPAPGREAARLDAARGTGSATERWFQLEGGITLVQGSDRVETERARFDGKDRLVRGDAPVTLRGDGYSLAGPGFTLDPDARTVRMAGGAALRTGSAVAVPTSPASRGEPR